MRTRVLDGEPISWSADDRRLLFVRLETDHALPIRLVAELVQTVDVVSGVTETLALGMNPVRSPHQRTLWFESSRWIITNCAT